MGTDVGRHVRERKVPRHAGKPASQLEVTNAKVGMHADGGGLYLQVTTTQRNKSWLFRYTVGGRERQMGARAMYPSSDFIFPETKLGSPLSNTTFTKVLRDMGYATEATPRGMRSAFKDWCAEIAKARDEVSEAAPAHTITGKVRAAYLRTGAGLLREIAIGEQRTYFDTNTSNHNHFFVEAEDKLIDIVSGDIRVDGLPDPPEHLSISHIDAVVRLVVKRAAARQRT